MSAVPVEELREFFAYDPVTGDLVRLKRNHKAGALGVQTSKDCYGYISLSHNGRHLKAHRVAWALQTGSWPSGLIDHINRVKSDNRWHNLRDVTPSQNNINTDTSKDNKSGKKGVFYIKRINRWWAYINANCKRTSLGFFITKEEAVQARVAAEAVLHTTKAS